MTLARRKGKRRTRQPYGLDRDGVLVVASEGEPVAFGRQAELCRGTVCAACFAAHWRAHNGANPIDWTALPSIVGETRSEAHHEPPRGTAVASTDRDTIPLCQRCHGRKGDRARAFAVRHASRFDNDPSGFYIAANIYKYVDGERVPDWEAVRDEMRRRAQGLTRPSRVVIELAPVVGVESEQPRVGGPRRP